MNVSRFQYYFYTALTVVVIAWLYILTSMKEFWGFWQSPKEYYYLAYEYPLWIRDYVQTTYYPTFWFTVCTYFGWMLLTLREFPKIVNVAALYRRVLCIVAMTLFLGGVFGMLGANNFIGWIHKGKLHGTTHVVTQP